MRDARNLIAMLFTLLITAACGDGPTSPSQARDLPAGAAYNEMSVQGCVSDDHCVLPPISSDPTEPPPDCDVWWKPDCGACATGGIISGPDYVGVASACPGGGGTSPGPGGDPTDPGGGGGGSGGTAPPPPCPDYDPDCAQPEIVDTQDDLIDSQERLPDCSNSATWTKDWHGPYCNGQAPAGAVLTAYNAEINAMLAKGGMCAELARFGQGLLSRGMVRYYTSPGSTAKSWGGSGIGLIMDDSYIVNQPPYDHGFALAHELEHAYSGYVHVAGDKDSNGVNRTPNDWCG
jgi:hypothetical protein